MGEKNDPIKECAKAILVLVFIVPIFVRIIRDIGLNVGGLPGSILDAIANIISPETTIIILLSSAAIWWIKESKSYE